MHSEAFTAESQQTEEKFSEQARKIQNCDTDRKTDPNHPVKRQIRKYKSRNTDRENGEKILNMLVETILCKETQETMA